jgi:methyl-accepting chemotaxis protein
MLNGAELVSANIKNTQSLLRELAKVPDVQSMDAQTQREILFPYIAELGVYDIAVISTAGDAYHIKGKQRVNIANRPYVRAALSGKAAISDILLPKVSAVNTDFPLLNYTVPIERNGSVVGALLAMTNALALSDSMKAVKSRGAGYAYMINGEGTVIAHALRPEIVAAGENSIEKSKTDPSFAPLAGALRLMLQEKRGFTSYIYRQGNMACGFTAVAGFDMYLIVTANKANLFGDVYALLKLIFMVMAISVAVGIGASIWLARSIARPLAGIGDALRSIGEGDLTREVAAKRQR